MKPFSTSLKLMAAFAFICFHQAFSGDFSASEVLKIWKLRAENLQGVDITYETSHKEMFVPDFDDDRSHKIKPRLITYQSTSRLLINGEMMRLENKGMCPHYETGELTSNDRICSYDSQQSKSLSDPDNKTGHPQGYIENKPYIRSVVNIGKFHFIQAYAPHLLPVFSIDFKKVSIAPEKESVNGHSCIVLHREGAPSGMPTIELWLDPQAEFSIRRMRSHNWGRLLSQQDIDYVFEAGHWVPSEWSRTSYNYDGSEKHSSKGTVTRQLFQQKLTQKDFKLNFPEGIHISDQRTEQAKK